MNNRINVVVNGRQDLPKVIENLRPLFDSEDKMLLYTFNTKGKVCKAFKSVLGKDDKYLNENMTYMKYDAYSGDIGDASKMHKFTVFAMPKNLLDTIPCSFNAALSFVDTLKAARFVHFFCDDLKFVNAEKYDPSRYEWYMTTFNCPFITDPKTNTDNFAFKKASPRFVLVSRRLQHPISFYQFEGKEHFIFDRDVLKENFDAHLYRMYMSEFVIRLCNKGILKHMTFYPDPFLELLLQRDTEMEYTPITDLTRKQLASDDKYISETLHEHVIPESSVDPIVEEHGSVIDGIPCEEVANGN